MYAYILSILIALNAQGFKIINKTKLWTAHDTKMVEAAMEGCKRHYPKDAPALHTFIKLRENDYQVICGIERSEVHTSRSVTTRGFVSRTAKKQQQKD